MTKFIRNCIIVLLGSLFFMSSTCDPGFEYPFDQKVIVNNQTDEEIMIFSVIGNYPDIIEENLKSVYYSPESTKMISANSATLLYFGFPFNNDGTPYYNMMLILIIRRSTLDKYPFNYLIENNIHDDKYLLCYDELKSMNFEFSYKD